MTEEQASVPITIASFDARTPELIETAAELSAELLAAVESHVCTVCRERYSATTNWQCSCFTGFGL
jgi:hypothetical protein